MKKFLPLILLGVGLLVLVGAFIFVKNSKNKSPQVEEETAKEIPVGERPVVSLVPSADGHYLKLTISKIMVKKAASLDYELLYTLPDGRTQGVPGTVKLTGGDIIKDLLLGSESSGKFRYDEGVDGGTVTIRFRDDKGKLLGKLSTKFAMQSGVTTLTVADSGFTYELDKVAKGVYFVTIQTFADPDPSTVVVYQNGYAVFASDGKPHTGKVVN
ncbi:MAG: hypothetical protein ACHQUA_01495, partial [Microgenomates group bacterium]